MTNPTPTPTRTTVLARLINALRNFVMEASVYAWTAVCTVFFYILLVILSKFHWID